MSRESDSSSPGSQGRGGAAYPSGTPPYGSRPFPSLHPQDRPRPADAAGTGGPAAPEPAEPAADEPKTETTLTTRIRINIPGSRPIPPVVVRTTVDENNPAPAAPAPEPAPAVEPAPGAEAPAEPEPEKTSDWFAPRKTAAAPPPAAPAAPGAPVSGQPRPPAPGPGTASTPYLPPPVGAPLDGGPAARGPHDTPAGGFASPFGSELPYSTDAPRPDPFAEQPFGTESFGGEQPYGTENFPPGVPRPNDPFAGAGSGAGAGPGAAPAPFPGPDPFAPEGRDPQGPSQQLPYGAAQNAAAGYAPPRDPAAPPVDGPIDPNAPFPEYQPPAGPTSGPVTGAMQMPPATDRRGPAGPAGFRPDDTNPGFRPDDTNSGFRPEDTNSGFRPEDTNPGFRPPVPPPGAGQGQGPGNPNERLSGDTVVSGIPAVPAGEQRAPRPPAPAAPRPAPPKKKGRSKLVLLCVGATTILVMAYGAGLLMDHADVPKGTTVLGVDIGNQSRDDAVKMLDTALGNRTTAPLTLTIGNRKQSLKPSVAGLSIDTQATVRAVAHSDYNPVSVIGSLLGGSRDADPVILVDEDKLKVALQSLAGKSGPGTDGMVRFSAGKAIAVPGKPRQTFDVDAAARQVSAAYRTRAETGADSPIALAVSSAPARPSQADLDAAVNGFGKTAMSDLVTVRSKGVHFISFGPKKSLPKFLTMVTGPDGKLRPHIDLDVLKGLYGSTFNNVLLERSDGTKTAVTPQDVATALIPALSGTTASQRDVTLPRVVG